MAPPPRAVVILAIGAAGAAMAVAMAQSGKGDLLGRFEPSSPVAHTGSKPLKPRESSPAKAPPPGDRIPIGDSTCRADLSGDGHVDVTDMVIVLSNWGSCPTRDCTADLTADFVVDLPDLIEVLTHWGPCGPDAPTSK